MNASSFAPEIDADRLIVCISDAEMGAGGHLDDFPQSAWLGDLVASYDTGPHADMAIDVVFNGDTFDFLKTAYLGRYPRHVTRDVALGKFLAIASAHTRFFEGIRRFLRSERGPRRVFFIAGNHDFELLFPEVQDALRALCGPRERVYFPGFELDLGDVHMEHGHQDDSLFRMDPTKLFVEHHGERILNLPWGAVALLDVILPLHPLFFHHDRLKPRGRVFELVPELKDLAMGMYWQYYTRDFVRAVLTRNDPVKKMRWTMFREVASRFGSRDIQVHVGDKYIDAIEQGNGWRVCLIGHLHEAQWRSVGDRKLLVTGAIRNEFMLADDESLHLMPKVYAEVFQKEGRAVRSRLVEVDGPPVPEGYTPGLRDVVPEIRKLLGAVESTDEILAEIEDQERAEAAEPENETEPA